MNTITKNSALALALAAMSLSACDNKGMEMPAEPEAPAVEAEVSQEVIYQANPRFFGTNECLKALAGEIDRIASMGCDVLWVMPVQQEGELNAIGSPYCISDYKSVNSRYGTMADFRALVDKAHSAGMRVMLDWVANHTSWDNVWITAHPDYYQCDAEGNIMQASTWSDVAQLDMSNTATQDAMIDAMTYWVEETGIDGFRCDYADGPGHQFWSRAIAALREINPALEMLAESADTGFYADGFDMVYDWQFAPAMSKLFTGGKSADFFSQAASTWSAVPEGSRLLRYTFNHDYAAENSVSQTYGSPDAIPAAYVLTAMLHGTPMIYSSMDAEGVSGTLSFFNYAPLEWSASLGDTYRAINQAYRATAEVRRGQLATYDATGAVVFTRSTPEEKLLVMVNTTAQEQTVKTPISLAGAEMTDLIGGSAVTPGVTVTLQPYGYIIYGK